MADQLSTTESQLYEAAFPSKDLSYWLGKLLQEPTSGTPTQEDWQREQGQIGLPTREQSAKQSGTEAFDYLVQFLGPLMALMSSQQYARQKTGHPAPTWKEQADYTKANSPLEAMRNWRQAKPWQKPTPVPEDERYWYYRPAPRIGGPTGQGKSLEEIYRHRAPLEMEDEVLDRLLQQWKTMTRPGESGGPTGPLPMPPMPGRLMHERLANLN